MFDMVFFYNDKIDVVINNVGIDYFLVLLIEVDDVMFMKNI